MAQGKKSFLVYLDSRNLVDKLSDERAGKLFKNLFSYCADEEPIVIDEVVDMVFEHFKGILKRDLKKYESIIERNTKNGLLGGRPKKEETQNNPVGLLETQITQANPKKADTVNDNVSDNVNDNKKENKNKHPKLASDTVLLEIEANKNNKMEGFNTDGSSYDFIKYFDVADGFRKIIMAKVKSNGGSVEKLKEAKIGAWIKPIRDMYVIDKIEGNSIKAVYKWLPTSDFWSKNVLSTQSLRNKFNQLVAEAKNNTPIDTSKRIFG